MREVIFNKFLLQPGKKEGFQRACSPSETIEKVSRCTIQLAIRRLTNSFNSAATETPFTLNVPRRLPGRTFGSLFLRGLLGLPFLWFRSFQKEKKYGRHLFLPQIS